MRRSMRRAREACAFSRRDGRFGRGAGKEGRSWRRREVGRSMSGRLGDRLGGRRAAKVAWEGDRGGEARKE